ncbi:MAG: type I-A CRISPR-associated protein Csa5 [Thermodesulfobacteriota bacterium]
MSQKIDFDDVSRALAAVTLATGTYSLIDRISNALTPDTVNKAIYDLSRNLEELSSSVGETFIRQIEKEEAGKKWTVIEVKRKNEEDIKTIWGYLARPEKIRKFQDEIEKDITIARKVAAYAMYLVAHTSLMVSKGEVEV